MITFRTLEVDRATGLVVSTICGGLSTGNPLAQIRAAAPTGVEIIDALAYAVVVTGIPATVTLNAPFSFQVGWQQIGPTEDPFPTSPIAVEVEGGQFTYTPDQASHQATVTIAPSVAGPLKIRVGDQSFTVEVS